MALEPFLLEVVACPETHRPLRHAQPALLAKLIAAVDRQKLKARSQQVVKPKLQAALVRDDDKVAYPVWDDSPCLLVGAATPLEQLD